MPAYPCVKGDTGRVGGGPQGRGCRRAAPCSPLSLASALEQTHPRALRNVDLASWLLRTVFPAQTEPVELGQVLF